MIQQIFNATDKIVAAGRKRYLDKLAAQAEAEYQAEQAAKPPRARAFEVKHIAAHTF